jgi:hypothetical protein
MIAFSIVVAILGVVAGWLVAKRLAGSQTELGPDGTWLIGMLGLFPGWLVPFIGLLGLVDARGPRTSVAAWWILSAAAALGGAIFTHARLRARVDAGVSSSRETFFRLGVFALVPAWALALGGAIVAGAGAR